MNQIQKLTQAIRNCAGCELDYGTLRTLKMIDDESAKMERAFVGKPPLCDASGLLKKAYQELMVIASYADDENCPTLGLKMTAKAYQKLCDEIKAAGFA